MTTAISRGKNPRYEHEHKLYVQDFETDKYFIALRVCVCGDSKVGNLNIQLSNADGETLQLAANEYGQVDYADVYGDWLVTILDEDGTELSVFDLSAGEAPEEPTEPENPDEGGEPSEPENPVTETANPKTLMTENPKRRKIPTTGMAEKRRKNRSNLRTKRAAALRQLFCSSCSSCSLRAASGAVIFLKKKKKKNQKLIKGRNT